MIHVNEKYFTSHSQLRKDDFCQKKKKKNLKSATWRHQLRKNGIF